MKYFHEETWEQRVRAGVHIDVNVRFSECDPYGHLNNTVPFRYFEDARIELLTRLDCRLDEHFLVVADAQCDYLRQVKPLARIRVYANVLAIGTTSCDVHYAAVDESERLVFVGRTRLVNLTKEGRPDEWAPALKNRLHIFNESAII